MIWLKVDPHLLRYQRTTLERSLEVGSTNEQRTEQRKTRPIMFTDMVGYSALAQRNEALALQLLEEHRVCCAALPKYQGTEIKTTGDGSCRVRQRAARCSAPSKSNARSHAQCRLRCGSALQCASDSCGRVHHEAIVGRRVNIASRIEPLAAGRNCISMDVSADRNAIEASLSIGPRVKNIHCRWSCSASCCRGRSSMSRRQPTGLQNAPKQTGWSQALQS